MYRRNIFILISARRLPLVIVKSQIQIRILDERMLQKIKCTATYNKWLIVVYDLYSLLYIKIFVYIFGAIFVLIQTRVRTLIHYNAYDSVPSWVICPLNELVG